MPSDQPRTFDAGEGPSRGMSYRDAGVDRLRTLESAEIFERVRAFREMTAFEDLSVGAHAI